MGFHTPFAGVGRADFSMLDPLISGDNSNLRRTELPDIVQVVRYDNGSAERNQVSSAPCM